MAKSLDVLAEATDALVAPWDQYNLLYAFPLLPLILHLLRRVEAERIPVILVAPDWPRRLLMPAWWGW